MLIQELQLQNFRNIASLNIKPGKGFNLIYGPNGAGKTSILEAIYCLSYGKSFRSTKLDQLIQNNNDLFTVFAKLAPHDNRIGFKRALGATTIQYNDERTSSLSRIALCIPTQLITTSSYRIFTDGPKARRQFLNWGLYYTEPPFTKCWRALQKALQNRNACLKQRRPLSEMGPWTAEYIQCATQVDAFYQAYITELEPIFSRLIRFFLPDITLSLTYNRGWPMDQSLEACLLEHQDNDYRIGHTQKGAHRADLQVSCHQKAAHDYLSQGQLKLAAYALILAQGKLLHQKTRSAPIYLIDDLPAELDPSKQQLVLQSLAELKAQSFVTGINKKDLAIIADQFPAETFQVCNGNVSRETSAIAV
jgi:DNA replication and repair protein RecF